MVDLDKAASYSLVNNVSEIAKHLFSDVEMNCFRYIPFHRTSFLAAQRQSKARITVLTKDVSCKMF